MQPKELRDAPTEAQDIAAEALWRAAAAGLRAREATLQMVSLRPYKPFQKHNLAPTQLPAASTEQHTQGQPTAFVHTELRRLASSSRPARLDEAASSAYPLDSRSAP
jgi:hypothetical protein